MNKLPKTIKIEKKTHQKSLFSDSFLNSIQFGLNHSAKKPQPYCPFLLPPRLVKNARENLAFVFREIVWCLAHIELFSGTGIFDAMNTPTTLSTTITSTTSTSLTTITTTTRSIRGNIFC